MESFVYISIIIATLLYIVGFIFLFRYKRDKIKYLEEELNALNNILDSSDRMIDELNNLSDYVTMNIEDKTKELKSLLTIADGKIKDFKLANNYNFKPNSEKVVVQSSNNMNEVKNNNLDNLIDDINQIKKPEFNKVQPKTKSFSAAIGAYESNKNILKDIKDNKEDIEDNNLNDEKNPEQKAEDKHTVYSRKDEIQKLLDQGLSTTEIAKKLGMGKGEIDLIVGLKN